MNRFPDRDEFRPTSGWLSLVIVFETILLASLVVALVGIHGWCRMIR